MANFTTTSSTGEIFFVNNKAEIETMKIRNFSETHYFTTSDINDDQKNEFIFADNKTLYVYNMNKECVFTYNVDGTIIEMPEIIKIKNNCYIQIRTNEKIYLITNKGSLVKNFPIKSQAGTVFSKVNQLKLIHTNNKSINVIDLDL